MMKISIVIPNRNGGHLLGQNLPFVLAAADGNEVIVVDDASTDGSLELIRKKFSSVVVVARKNSGGFACSVNCGVKQATGEIVVLLNTDVRPEKGFIRPIMKHFDTPNVFAVGCLELSIEGDRMIRRGRGIAEWQKGFFIHRRGEVDKLTTAWVSGGSGAFRKSTWDKLGGMDVMYSPFYWEDIDLSYRALKSGYSLVFEPKSIVTHEHARGAIRREFSPLWVSIISYRNQFLFIWKNLSDTAMFAQHLLWAPLRIIQAVSRGDAAMVIGFILAVFLLPSVIISRIRSVRYWILRDVNIPLG